MKTLLGQYSLHELCAALEVTRSGYQTWAQRGVSQRAQAAAQLLPLLRAGHAAGRGNRYDNAAMESFWSALKRELIYQRHFATRGEARAAIFEWIEVFYNRVRRHSALGFHSPVDFETKLN